MKPLAWGLAAAFFGAAFAVVPQSVCAQEGESLEDILTTEQIETADADQLQRIARTRGIIDTAVKIALEKLANDDCRYFLNFLESYEGIVTTQLDETTRITFTRSGEPLETSIPTLRKSQKDAVLSFLRSRLLVLTKLDCPPPVALPRQQIATTANLNRLTAREDSNLAGRISELAAQCDEARFEQLKTSLLQAIDGQLAYYNSQPARPEDPSFATAIAAQMYKLLIERRRVEALQFKPCPQQVQPAPGTGTDRRFGLGPAPRIPGLPGAPAEEQLCAAGFTFDAATNACLAISTPLSETSFQLRFGFSYSNVELNSSFGTGTVVTPDDEDFAAETPDSIDRAGFDADAKLGLGGSGLILDGRHHISAFFSYAEGSESSSGAATVDIDEVSGIGETLLDFDAVLMTGVGTDAAGDFIEALAHVENRWHLGGISYGESFRLGGPDTTRIHYSIGTVFERIESTFAASSEILRPPATLLVSQSTDAETLDRYFGLKLGVGFSQPLTARFLFGVDAYLTPSYRDSEAHISQFTDFTTDLSQSFDHSDSGFALTGGVGAHLSFDVGDRVHLKTSYEYSQLGGVTEVHVPANPDQQPAFFDSGAIDRHFLKAGARIEF